MTSVMVPVRRLTSSAFGPYGEVLKKPDRPADIAGNAYDWWDRVASVHSQGDGVELGWLTVFRRAFRFDRMERHRRATQTFIPLEGKALIFSVAPASDPADGALPDPTAIEAFILDGTTGVHINPGIWHSTLFPFAERAEILLVVRANTPYDDAEWAALDRIDTSCILDFTRLELAGDQGGSHR